MTLRVVTPRTFRLYCRGCQDIKWHVPVGGSARCVVCKRPTSGAEIVTTYSVDDLVDPPELLLPAALLPGYAQLEQEAPEPVEPEFPPDLEPEDWELLAIESEEELQ